MSIQALSSSPRKLDPSNKQNYLNHPTTTSLKATLLVLSLLVKIEGSANACLGYKGPSRADLCYNNPRERYCSELEARIVDLTHSQDEAMEGLIDSELRLHRYVHRSLQREVELGMQGAKDGCYFDALNGVFSYGCEEAQSMIRERFEGMTNYMHGREWSKKRYEESQQATTRARELHTKKCQPQKWEYSSGKRSRQSSKYWGR